MNKKPEKWLIALNIPPDGWHYFGGIEKIHWPGVDRNEGFINQWNVDKKDAVLFDSEEQAREFWKKKLKEDNPNVKIKRIRTYPDQYRRLGSLEEISN